MSTTSRRALVLLAEDNEDHVLLTQLAFERARVLVDLAVVRDGVECLDYLLQRNGFEEAPRPDLLLLDMHMPRMGGLEVMAFIAGHDRLNDLPVVALTTSDAPEDVARMYGMRVSSYISKPVTFDKFSRLVTALAGYWFEVVVLPGRTP